MAKFIELTNYQDNKVLVNINQLLGVYTHRVDGKTGILLGADERSDIYVKESYDQVKAMLEVE